MQISCKFEPPQLQNNTIFRDVTWGQRIDIMSSHLTYQSLLSQQIINNFINDTVKTNHLHPLVSPMNLALWNVTKNLVQSFLGTIKKYNSAEKWQQARLITLSDRMNDCLFERWIVYILINWLTNWLIDWLIDWMTEWLNPVKFTLFDELCYCYMESA